MKLSTLVKPWINTLATDVEIVGLQNDSRHVKPGDVFIAYPGAVTDGRTYVAQAISNGAVAILYEPNECTIPWVTPLGMPCYPISELSSQLAPLACRYYDNPSESLSVTGVTGTNGKTTIAYQLTQAHQLLGKRSAYIGTIGEGEIGQFKPLMNTTPDALCLQRMLHQYYLQGVQQVCMEVSSHALEEHRVDRVAFKEAIYTNLSHEHLDYHVTLEAYAKAKARLFSNKTLEWVILNRDDEYAGHMARVVPQGTRILTYGIEQSADVRASNCELLIHGSRFTVTSPWGCQTLTISSLGMFNIYNSLAVYTSLLAHGYPIAEVVDVMATIKASPGRMEIVAQEPYVIVDYAHTPAALENVLRTLVQLKGTSTRKLWVVFGCGGDRDKTKRPIMGKVASDYADAMILTNDNPRFEDPEDIIKDIMVGISSTIAVTLIPDRHEALAHVLEQADKNDIVLIAGKGHEDYQIIKDKRLVFSDQCEVRRLLGI